MNQQIAVTNYFNANPAGYARDYEAETSVGYSFRVRRARLLELLGRGAGRVLDIGCGPGVMAQEILARGWEYVGRDLAPAMIDEARRRFANDARATFAVGSAEHSDAPDRSFDVVVAMGLVEYVADDALALREMHRVLKPGGLLLVSLPNWWSPARMWDRWVLSPAARLLGRKARTSVRHREYRPAAYRAALRENGFLPDKTVAYNFRVIPRPFDRWFGHLSARVAAALEGLRHSYFWWIATGVIVAAKKV